MKGIDQNRFRYDLLRLVITFMQLVLEPLETVFLVHPIESLTGNRLGKLPFRPTLLNPATEAVKVPADILKLD